MFNNLSNGPGGAGGGGEPARYLWLPIAGPKRDRMALRARLPAALDFVAGHLSCGRRVLVHCDDGAAPFISCWSSEMAELDKVAFLNEQADMRHMPCSSWLCIVVHKALTIRAVKELVLMDYVPAAPPGLTGPRVVLGRRGPLCVRGTGGAASGVRHQREGRRSCGSSAAERVRNR